MSVESVAYWAACRNFIVFFFTPGDNADSTRGPSAATHLILSFIVQFVKVCDVSTLSLMFIYIYIKIHKQYMNMHEKFRV
jgi:hypothetical protein